MALRSRRLTRKTEKRQPPRPPQGNLASESPPEPLLDHPMVSAMPTTPIAAPATVSEPSFLQLLDDSMGRPNILGGRVGVVEVAPAGSELSSNTDPFDNNVFGGVIGESRIGGGMTPGYA